MHGREGGEERARERENKKERDRVLGGIVESIVCAHKRSKTNRKNKENEHAIQSKRIR